jgi:CotH kinase protein
MRLWITLATVAVAVLSLSVQAQFGFGQEELKLVERFDKNGDGRLDAAERRTARSAAVPNARGRFRGFGGGGGGTPEPGRTLRPSDVRTYPASTPLYDIGALRTLFLQFEANDWEDELAAFHNTDVEVPATLTVDGRTFKDVGVHFRGASSFMMTPEGYKRSLNVSLDFAHASQVLGGYRTLNLLNAANDPTFLRAVLYTEIARQYIPAPRMNYVRVVINGESWGIYLNAQQFNSDFTRDEYGATGGARWKTPGSPGGQAGLEYLGESPDLYKGTYEIKTRDTGKSWAQLIALTRVLNRTPTDRLEAALAPMLDIDGVLKFLAIEVALVNSDGYWTRASDYNLYQDPKGVFHIIPHDVNEGLGGGGRGGFGFGGGGGVDLDPLVAVNDPSKPLRSRLLGVPALRTRYLGYLRDIAERQMDWSAVAPRAQRYQGLIAGDVKADTRKLYSTEEFTSDVAGLQSFFNRRRALLLR